MEPKMFSMNLYDALENCTTLWGFIYFRYVKELYTPYVIFEGKCITDQLIDASGIKRIEFCYWNNMIYRGLVDSIDVCRKDGQYIISVKSKSFTSLLCQNQPEPGLMAAADLSGVIETYPDIPYVTCENSSVENYIFIKDGSSIWDAVCNLGYKQTGMHPYIEASDIVRITKRAYRNWNFYRQNTVIASGTSYDFTHLISHIHMQDINDSYDVYSQSAPEALSRDIIRHKQIPLDRQFLNNPYSALDYKLKFGARGLKCNYITYIGFDVEDLFDKFSYIITNEKNEIVQTMFDGKDIHKIETVFNGVNVMTTLGSYEDRFVT